MLVMTMARTKRCASEAASVISRSCFSFAQLSWSASFAARRDSACSRFRRSPSARAFSLSALAVSALALAVSPSCGEVAQSRQVKHRSTRVGCQVFI
jgi:hypothetical protein